MSRALALHDVSLPRRLGGTDGARTADRRRGRAQSLALPTSKLLARGSCDRERRRSSRPPQFFRAVGEATHNGVFMLAHEPLVQTAGALTRPAMIDKVPQAAARIATAQRRISAAIRAQDPIQAGEWMAKHIRDFRRGFEIARIALEKPIIVGS